MILIGVQSKGRSCKFTENASIHFKFGLLGRNTKINNICEYHRDRAKNLSLLGPRLLLSSCAVVYELSS